MGTRRPNGHSSFVNRTLGLLPAAWSSLESGEGESIIIRQIAATDVKMKYRFNNCAFRLTNHAPGPGTASTDASSDNRTRESRPQLPPKLPTVLPGAGDPKQRPGSGSLLPAGGDGWWLLHTHHLVSPAQAQERSCPSLQHRTQAALGGLAGRHGPTWELGVAPEMLGFPGGTSGKEPAYQSKRWKRHQFDPWVGKIPWRRAWQPTPVFLPGESHGQRSLRTAVCRVAEPDTCTHTRAVCFVDCGWLPPPAPPRWALRGPGGAERPTSCSRPYSLHSLDFYEWAGSELIPVTMHSGTLTTNLI